MKNLIPKQQFDVAIDSFKKAIRINPHYAEVYNNMGLALQNKNELEKTIQKLKISKKQHFTETLQNL